MAPGTGPWGSGPDRGNRGSYLCLGWNAQGESRDTLFSEIFWLADTCGESLRVRTLLRFGSHSSGNTSAASCRILATAYGDSHWVVIRDYGRDDFVGYDVMPIPSPVRYAGRVQFAWVAHVYDTTDLRYWCIDNVSIINNARLPLLPIDVAVMQSLRPQPNDVLPPSNSISAEAMIGSRSSFDQDVTVRALLDETEIGIQQVRVPAHRRVPVRFEVGRDVDEEVLLREHTRRHMPYRSSGEVNLGPGRHTIKFVAQARYGADDFPENDTLVVPFTVAGELWQSVPGEYPVPRKTIRGGFTIAGDEQGRIYVRNSGSLGSGAAFMRLFMSCALPAGTWSRLPSFEPYLEAGPSERPTLGGACVVNDSLFFCELDDAGPLMKYDIAAGRWGITSYPSIAAMRRGGKCDLAGGVCWDGNDGVYVLGHSELYRYALNGDSWSIVPWQPRPGGPLGIGDTCGDAGDVAFLDGCLYTLTVDRSLVRYDVRTGAWRPPLKLPGEGRIWMCRLAADPVGRRIYVLTYSGLKGDPWFLAFSPARDSWILDLPTPEWAPDAYSLMPLSALTRAGRYLVAAKPGDNRIYMFSLPIPEPSQSYYGPIRR